MLQRWEYSSREATNIGSWKLQTQQVVFIQGAKAVFTVALLREGFQECFKQNQKPKQVFWLLVPPL